MATADSLIGDLHFEFHEFETSHFLSVNHFWGFHETLHETNELEHLGFVFDHQIESSLLEINGDTLPCVESLLLSILNLLQNLIFVLDKIARYCSVHEAFDIFKITGALFLIWALVLPYKLIFVKFEQTLL